MASVLLLSIGATVPTGFGDDFDPELLPWALGDWASRGIAGDELRHTDDLAARARREPRRAP